MRKVGAPKGARVHWFLLQLPEYISKNYYARYDYSQHNYFLYRRCSKISNYNFFYSDFYIITRTSKRCWRISAHYCETAETYYMSTKTSKECGEVIENCARLWHNNRSWQDDREYIENKIKIKISED